MADLTGALEGNDGRAHLHEYSDWSSLADDELYRMELRQRLVSALATLPVIYRRPVLFRDVQGLSTDEADGMLKFKPQTLKSRLHHGRLILRKQLAEFSSGLALHNPLA